VILTYNRPEQILQLLQDIVVESSVHEVEVSVYDDASSSDYASVKELLKDKGWSYIRSDKHHGKKLFWSWVGKVYSDQRGSKAQFFVFLPDDVRLCRDFVTNCVAVWNEIGDRRKIAMTLKADTRLQKSNWTGIKPRKQGRVWHTGWVDGDIFCTAEYLKVLGYSCPEVASTRWDRNADLGSGVGQVLSVELHRQGRSMWCSDRSLTVHSLLGSKMNPDERRKNPLRSARFLDGPGPTAAFEKGERVTISMASIPSRASLLPRVIDRLYWQCDRLHVYLNGYGEIPKCLKRPRIVVARSQDHGDRGDAGKFYWVGQTKGYVITCDDDILYPQDYVATLVRAVERFKRKAVVGTHGAIIHPKPTSYYRSRDVLHCRYDQERDRRVHVLGTGTTCFHHSTIRVHSGDFKVPNMADLWLALLARKQSVPLVCLAHKGGWMEFFEDPKGNEIYKRYAARDEVQTRLVVGAAPWPSLPNNVNF